MKFALLIGNNAYPEYPLSGCIPNVQAWKDYLARRGCQCTQESNLSQSAMISCIEKLFSNADRGDSIILGYSGHGSKIEDRNGDEADGFDEVLCPVDWPTGCITDDDLAEMIAQVPKGVTLDIILDCCHSGTATRGIDRSARTPRCIPGPATHGAKARTIARSGNMNHVLWAGCKASETSAELAIGGVPRGIFSYYLIAALDAHPGWSRSQIIKQVRKDTYGYQTPQLEGPSDMLKLPF